MNHIAFIPGRRCGQTMARRWNCHLNTIEHSDKYGYGFDLDDLWRLEKIIDRMSPAFINDDEIRYRVTMRVNGQRIVFIYDVSLNCIVTCRPASALGSGYYAGTIQ